MRRTYYVYILASQKNGTLYIGVTNNLQKRVWQHKTKEAEGFTKNYKVDKLVYYEETDEVTEAIRREKQLKRWLRAYKLKLINDVNPSWKDLSKDWF